MRVLYSFLLFLLVTVTVQAQYVIEPLKNNPTLSRYHIKQQQAQSKLLERYAGNTDDFSLRGDDCELDFPEYWVYSGETLNVFVDTVGMGLGTISLEDCSPLNYGTPTLDTTMLTYVSNTGVNAGVDTVCVKFCPVSGDCQILHYPILVKRRGVTYDMPGTDVAAEGIVETTCLSPSLTGELYCSRLIDCQDDYQGENDQWVFMKYNEGVDTCFFYLASRFGGTDMVCVEVCDVNTVCDTFRFPFHVIADTLGLPFFEDFSYEGPYPSAEKWLDKNVFINNTMAKNPPSIGMATFDGLDRGGSLYPNSGKADYLTSTYLDLSTVGVDDDVYLKFFVEPKGYGNGPSGVDSLLLEFKTMDGEWVRIDAYAGGASGLPPFEFHSYPIEEERFLYDGFQFRFTNYVSPPSRQELWNLDYILLDAHQTADNSFRDMAFTEPPTSFLKTYTAMPVKQFLGYAGEEMTDTFYTYIYNHFTDEEQKNIENSLILLTETKTGTVFPDFTLVNGADANIPRQEPVVRERINPSFGDFVNIMNTSFEETEALDFELQYNLTVASQAPFAFVNDSITTHVIMDDYLAYDDGTAELQFIFVNPNDVNPEVAIKYHTNVQDTLKGVQIHFPRVGVDVGSMEFSLKIWVGSLDSEPVYEANFLRPVFPDDFDEVLQGFTNYPLIDVYTDMLTPAFIPAGDFYIGIQQTSVADDGIPIGYDVNGAHKSQIFIKSSGNDWSVLDSNISGSLMVRAVFAEIEKTGVAGIDEGITDVFSLFPNPTKDILEISLPDDENRSDFQISVLDQLGRVLMTQNLTPQIDVSHYTPGVYFVRLKHLPTGSLAFKKVIIRR